VPFIVLYQREIAQLFDAHPDSFLFRDLPGAGAALAPRLLSAFGSDRERFKSAAELCTFSGIAPVRIASGKTGGKNPARKASIHFRCACPKFLRQSFHELVFTRSIEHENENDYEPRFVPRTRPNFAKASSGRLSSRTVTSCVLKLPVPGIRISLQNLEETRVLWKLYLGWHGHVFERLLVRLLAIGGALNNYEFWLSWKYPSVEVGTLVKEFPSRNFGVLIENLVDSETFSLACSRETKVINLRQGCCSHGGLGLVILYLTSKFGFRS
jgi:hypothetical protein